VPPKKKDDPVPKRDDPPAIDLPTPKRNGPCNCPDAKLYSKYLKDGKRCIDAFNGLFPTAVSANQADGRSARRMLLMVRAQAERARCEAKCVGNFGWRSAGWRPSPGAKLIKCEPTPGPDPVPPTKKDDPVPPKKNDLPLPPAKIEIPVVTPAPKRPTLPCNCPDAKLYSKYLKDGKTCMDAFNGLFATAVSCRQPACERA
jgi:hypothetical protein